MGCRESMEQVTGYKNAGASLGEKLSMHGLREAGQCSRCFCIQTAAWRRHPVYLYQSLSILPDRHRIITEPESPFLEAEQPAQDIVDVPASDVSCLIWFRLTNGPGACQSSKTQPLLSLRFLSCWQFFIPAL